MAEAVALNAQPRTGSGSGPARRLRRQRQVPGVLYGHKEATVWLAVSLEDLETVLRHHVRVVDLHLDGKKEQALIQDVQYDHLGRDVLHVDFKRVSADERVVVDVRLDLKGHAPGVTAGGVLDQPMHTLSVECLALSVPEFIRVTIDKLQIGEMLHVRDIVLPPGVKAMDDPEGVVVLVKAPVVEAPAAPTPEAAAAAAAEPEIIGRRVAEEEEKEEGE